MRLSLVLPLVLCLTLISLPAAAKGPGPSGTFRSDAGSVTLKYAGEGTVEVKLKTRYCALEVKDGATFVPDEGIHVVNAKQEPLLVIFYQSGKIVVYGELPAFKRAHCKGGADATGAYARVKK